MSRRKAHLTEAGVEQVCTQHGRHGGSVYPGCTSRQAADLIDTVAGRPLAQIRCCSYDGPMQEQRLGIPKLAVA
eukprot:1147146-Pelagomonas_calceolata.AAC.6